MVKVKKDGSGVVHVRHHAQRISISFGGSPSPPDEDQQSPLPSRAELQELVKSLGDGVELISATETSNRNDWNGYELVFRFSDINQLSIPEELYSLSDDDDEEEAESVAKSNDDAKTEPPQAAGEIESKADPPGYRFKMKDGELRIHSLLDQQPEDERPSEIGAVDPYAGEPAAAASPVDIGEAAKERILAKLLADMRIGIFVEVDGEIDSTNAIHRNDNLLTLVSLNLGKILDSPDAKKHMKRLTELKNSPDRRQRTQEISKQINGFDVDVQDPIVVKFR